MKKIAIITILISLIFSSCEELRIINCEECLAEEPLTTDIEIILDEHPGSNPPYLINVYRGKIEDGIIVESFSNYLSTSVTVSVNVLYTISASTEINGREYTAVSSVRPKVDIIEDVCEATCYWVKDRVVNLRFKYY